MYWNNGIMLYYYLLLLRSTLHRIAVVHGHIQGSYSTPSNRGYLHWSLLGIHIC